MRGKAVIRTYISGRVVEKSKFWVPAQTRVRSGRVKGNTSALSMTKTTDRLSSAPPEI